VAPAKGASLTEALQPRNQLSITGATWSRLQRVNALALGKGVFSSLAGRCQKGFEIEKKRVAQD